MLAPGGRSRLNDGDVVSRWRPALASAEWLLWWLGAVLGVISFADGPAWLLAVAASFVAFAAVCGDAVHADGGGLTPMTVFAFAGALTALANATGLLAANGPSRDQYFLYASDNYLLFASRVWLIGIVATILGFRWASRNRSARTLFSGLPRIAGNVPDRSLLFAGPLLAVGSIVFHVLFRPGLMGSITGTVLLLPHIVAFLLAYASTERRLRGAMALAMVVATLEGIRALLMAYLRSDIAAPFIAVALGALLGARSLAPLRSRMFIPLYVFGACFVIYFSAFAAARGNAGGVARLEAVAGAAAGGPTRASQEPKFWSRLTNFNQLSQIGRISTEDGFLHGQTLQYLGFVLIPRFLWPDKPIVQKGGWFAWKIGQAELRPDGRFSNAVNMTVPGELYLNFGWLGVIVGCLVFGGFVALLWDRTAFWANRHNMIGAAFGYYLFWTSLTLAADLQTVVTLLSTYCIFVAVGIGLRLIPRRAARSGGRYVDAAQPTIGPVGSSSATARP